MLPHKNSFRIDKDKVVYILINYSAYGLNFLSGLILARKLGPTNRGIYAYLSNLYVVAAFLISMNAKNASSIAQSDLIVNSNSEVNKLKIIKIYLVAAAVTCILSVIYFFYLKNFLDTRLVVIFCLANLVNSLLVVIQIHEGMLRTNNELQKLAILRFLGYGAPSLIVIVLFFFKSVEIELLVLAQSVAVLSCFLYVSFRLKTSVEFSMEKFRENAIRTYVSTALEFLIYFMPLMFVSISEDFAYIGHFVIAFGYVLISETYYQIIESKFYLSLSSSEGRKSYNAIALMKQNVRNLFLSQLVFIPGAYLIPVLYGTDYSESTKIALILILYRFLIAIVKLSNIYFNLVLKKFKFPIIQNSVHVATAMIAFFYTELFTGRTNPWIIAVIFSSIVISLLLFVLLNKKFSKMGQ